MDMITVKFYIDMHLPWPKKSGYELCNFLLVSEKDLYSKVLSLDNASELNNELEEDDKRNDYEMDRNNPESEALNG